MSYYRFLSITVVALLLTPTMSVGVGRIFKSVCLSLCLFVCLFVWDLFVWDITQKRLIPKAAFTPAQRVARQQVSRMSNMLRATSSMLRATCCAGVNAALVFKLGMVLGWKIEGQH